MAVCLYNTDENRSVLQHGKICDKTISAGKYWKIKIGSAGRAAVWNKLFRKTIINEMWFSNIPYLEDEYFLYRAILICSRISLFNEHLYYYRLRKKSVSHGGHHILIAPFRMKLFEEQLDYIVSHKTNKPFISFVLNNYFFTQSWYLNLGYYDILAATQEKSLSLIRKIPLSSISFYSMIKYIIWKINNKNYYKIYMFFIKLFK